MSYMTLLQALSTSDGSGKRPWSSVSRIQRCNVARNFLRTASCSGSEGDAGGFSLVSGGRQAKWQLMTATLVLGLVWPFRYLVSGLRSLYATRPGRDLGFRCLETQTTLHGSPCVGLACRGYPAPVWLREASSSALPECAEPLRLLSDRRIFGPRPVALGARSCDKIPVNSVFLSRLRL